MKQLSALSILVLLLLAAGPHNAQAQRVRVEFAPTLGFGLHVPNQVGDKGSISAGATAHLYLRHRSVSLILNPDFDYYLTDIDGVTAWQGDLNLLLGLGRRAFMPYVGVGAALTNVSGSDSFSGIESGTNFGINLLGGLRMGGGNVHPFFQGRYTLLDQSLYFKDAVTAETGAGFGVQGGLLFVLNP